MVGDELLARRGSVELCPPCWLLEPGKGITLGGHILENLLNSVRIRRDNKNGVLHKTKQEFMI